MNMLTLLVLLAPLLSGLLGPVTLRAALILQTQ